MSLEELVQEWLRSDRNKESRKEIKDLWDIRNVDELEKRMRPRIEFGTAGVSSEQLDQLLAFTFFTRFARQDGSWVGTYE